MTTALLALFVCATTGSGIVLAWSGVPYYDLWDGAIAFYLRVGDGDYAAWWLPHNEHRVVVTRALLWADMAWFGGTDIPVQFVDCLLVLFGAFTLWRMSRDIDPSRPPPMRAAFGLFLVAWLALWVQKENLTSGFQNSFILAQLLPLCAFDRLARSEGAPRRFAFACVLGIASAGTMINGLLTLPLMAIQSFLSGQGRRRVAILIGLAIVVTLLYFVGMPAVVGANAERPEHGTPLAFLQYLLYYLGGPFHFLLKEGLTGRVGATVAGASLIICATAIFSRVVRQQRPGATALALLAFIAYVLCSAVATSYGRSGFGTEQAFSSRYATPVLMAWAALAVLLPLQRRPRRAWARRTRVAAVAVLALMMIRLQTEAFKSQNDAVFDRRVAALALALQVDDRDRIRLIYPYPRHVLGIASRASAAHVSPFGRFPLRDVEALVGSKAAGDPLPACTGRIDRLEPVSGDARHVRVVGRMSDPSNRTPARIAFVDAQDDIVGFAIGGRKVGSTHDGFEGYVRAGDDAVARLRGEQPDCALRIVGAG